MPRSLLLPIFLAVVRKPQTKYDLTKIAFRPYTRLSYAGVIDGDAERNSE
jgi:hypothetical protein